jgi:catechol 2,3-dioxygenase-like lactoylglutathione lyase family enzyme
MKKVVYVTVFVKDQDRALEFYTRVLGFEKRLDNLLPGGGRFLTVGIGGDGLEVVLWPGVRGEAQPGPGLAPGALILEVDDCRKELKELKLRGMHEHFETTDVIERPDAFIGVIRDLDGNRLVLRQNRRAPTATER